MDPEDTSPNTEHLVSFQIIKKTLTIIIVGIVEVIYIVFTIIKVRLSNEIGESTFTIKVDQSRGCHCRSIIFIIIFIVFFIIIMISKISIAIIITT